MSWSIGYDYKWRRDIGYGVPAICDHPDCNESIDRGLAYVCCDSEPYGGEDGCGLYFCEAHKGLGKCERCETGKPPFAPKPDIEEWTAFKMTDPSWEEWRKENAEQISPTSERKSTVGEQSAPDLQASGAEDLTK